MADTLKERKIYRILTNATSKAWDKIAFWTTAKSVDASDGKNLQTKIGAINGITSDINGEATDVAASIKCVNQLNKNLIANGKNFYFDYKNGKYGYNTSSSRGADTFVPFKQGSGDGLEISINYVHSMYTYPPNPYIIKLDKAYSLLKGNVPARNQISVDNNYQISGYNQISVVKNSNYASVQDVKNNLTYNSTSGNNAKRYMTGINSGQLVNLFLKENCTADENLIPSAGFNLSDAEYLIISNSAYVFTGKPTFDIFIS